MARALFQGSMLRTLKHARGCYDYESILNRRAARKLLRATFKEAHGVAFGIARLDEPHPTRCIIIARGTDGALVSDERDIWNPHTWKVAARAALGGNE